MTTDREPPLGRGVRAGVRRLFRLPPRTPAMARDDADAELDAFLDERVAHLVARGMAPAAAREEALRRLGVPLGEARALLRRSAERREGRLRLHDRLDALRGDVRVAWRQCRKAPAVTAIAVLTLALGIGANAAIFSVVHRLLLAPLPYPNGHRIVMPVREAEMPSGTLASVGPRVVEAWRARSRTVDAIAGVAELRFSSRPDGAIDTIPSAMITANFLPLLGVRPALGRGFSPQEERGDSGTVAMIGHALWQRAYGGRPDVLGRTVSYEGRQLTIVGVTPPGLAIPMSRNAPPEIWMPTRLDQTGGGAGAGIGPGIFATLRPGASAEAATVELQTIARTVPATGEFVPLGGGRPGSVRVMRPRDFLGAREQRSLQVLFVAVGALLLIACANVANLLLGRAWTRQREFAVRGALGAGRARLARQVLTESVLLAVAGGALGVAVAWLALRTIVALRPPALHQLADVRLEPAVLLWSLGISVATGILFGAAPALLAGARRVGDVLRRETRGGSPGLTSRRVRSTLIVLEIAASLVLLVASGLLVRSFAALQRMPLGFEPRGLVYADVLIGGPRTPGRVPALRDAIARHLRTLPEVGDVALGVVPGKGWVSFDGVAAETGPGGQTTRVPTLGTIFISPSYFRVVRQALLAGRLPDSSTVPPANAPGFATSPEILVNRAFARRVWPEGGAIGARLRDADARPGARSEEWSTVVGVVDDTRMPEVRGDLATFQVYRLVPPRLGNVPYIVRATTSGDVAAPRIKQAIAAVDPSIYVRQVISGDTYLRDGLAPTRFAMALLTAFAVVAMALAAVGLYGVIAYSVGQRAREFGVRVALGAAPGVVVARVIGGGVRLAAAGVAIGAAAAAAGTRVMRSMLYGVDPADPLTFGVIALVVVTIALLASYVPARRVLRIDPTETLRAE